MRVKRRLSEISTRDYALTYRKLKYVDTDKVTGQVTKRHLKPAGERLAAVRVLSGAGAEYRRAVGKDRGITAEWKDDTSRFLLTNAHSDGICHKVTEFCPTAVLTGAGGRQLGRTSLIPVACASLPPALPGLHPHQLQPSGSQGIQLFSVKI